MLTLDAAAPTWLLREVWSRVLLWAGGARLVVEGQEHVDPSRPTIYASSHQSTIDIPVLYLAIPISIRFVAKSQLRWVPLIGWYMWLAGYVFVTRGNRRKSIASMKKAAEQIRSGTSIILFPEGTRSPDGYILPFKKGSFALAYDAGAAICPVTINGSGALMPKNSWRITPGEIRVRIGAPLDASKYSDRQQLLLDVREAIIRQSLEMGGRGEAQPSAAP